MEQIASPDSRQKDGGQVVGIAKTMDGRLSRPTSTRSRLD